MKYIKPEIEVFMLCELDIITASGEWTPDKDLEDLLSDDSF